MLRHSLPATLASLKFYRVERLAFIEADPDAPDGACAATIWAHKILKCFTNGRFKVIKLGNKPNVLAKHDQCVREGYSSAQGQLLFLIDSDYDRQLRRARQEDTVIYSHGYSVENDIFDVRCLHNLVTLFCGEGENRRQARISVDQRITEISSHFKWIHVADQLAQTRGSSVFTREKEGKPEVLISNPVRPNHNRVKQKITNLKSVPQSCGLDFLSFDFLDDGYGHVLEYIFYHLFRHACNAHGGSSLNKQAFLMLAASDMEDRVLSNENKCSYYAHSFHRAGAI